MQLHNFFHWSLLSIEINYCQLLLLLPRDFLQPLHQPLLYSYSKPVLTCVLECCHLVWLCCITSSILNYFSDLKFSPHWQHSSNGNHGNELWPKKKNYQLWPNPFPMDWFWYISHGTSHDHPKTTTKISSSQMFPDKLWLPMTNRYIHPPTLFYYIDLEDRHSSKDWVENH